MAIAGYQLSGHLIRILGLPKDTIGFELRAYPDEAVRIKCEYYPELADGGRALLAELIEYQLIEKPDSEDIKSPYLGTHHQKSVAKVDVKDAMKQITISVDVVGVKKLAARLKVAGWLIRFAGKIAGCGVKVNG